MNNKITNILLVSFLALAIAAGVWAYPKLPDQIASHWDINGRADDYSDKFWAVFLIPIIMLGMFMLYLAIPKIDPLKVHVQASRKYMNVFWVMMFAFFSYLLFLILAWNLSDAWNYSDILLNNFTRAIIPAFSVLVVVIGWMMGKVQRNWFMGIRTPWTLSSDAVWNKTHQVGSKLFIGAGLISALGFFWGGKTAFVLLLGPLMAAALASVIYSYIVYRRLS